MTGIKLGLDGLLMEPIFRTSEMYNFPFVFTFIDSKFLVVKSIIPGTLEIDDFDLFMGSVIELFNKCNHSSPEYINRAGKYEYRILNESDL